MTVQNRIFFTYSYFHNTILVHYFPPHIFVNCVCTRTHARTHTEPRSIICNIIPSPFPRSFTSAPSFSLSITFFHRFIILHLCYASQPIQFSESNPSNNIRLLICMCYITFTFLVLYRVSQEECARLREGVPYVKVYRCNPKHLYPNLNGYGDNGQRSFKL